MRIWLWDTFGRERVFSQGKNEDGVLDDVMRERGVEYFSRFAVVGGHFMFTNSSVRALPQPKIHAAVFRSPAEQIVSHFEFVSQRPQHPLHSGGTLEEVLTGDTKFLRETTNRQCRYVSGQAKASHAMKIFRQNEFILGCFDNLPEFVDRIAKILDVPQAELPRANVQERGYFDNHYTSKAAEIIREITREDEAIYQHLLKDGVWSTARAASER
jgi:hypothetical protein